MLYAVVGKIGGIIAIGIFHCQVLAALMKPIFLDCTIIKYDQRVHEVGGIRRVSKLRHEHLALRVYVYADGRMNVMPNPHFTPESWGLGNSDWKLEKINSQTEEEIKSMVTVENQASGIFDSTTYTLDRASLFLDITRFLATRRLRPVRVGNTLEVNNVSNFDSEAICSKAPEPDKLI